MNRTASKVRETERIMIPRLRRSKVKPHEFVPCAADVNDPYCARCGLVRAHEAHDLREFELVRITHTEREVLG